MISVDSFFDELEQIMMEKEAFGKGTTTALEGIAQRFFKKSPKAIASSRARAGAIGAMEQQGRQDVLGGYARKFGKSKFSGIGGAVGKMGNVADDAWSVIRKQKFKPGTAGGALPSVKPKTTFSGPTIPGFSAADTASMARTNDFRRVWGAGRTNVPG